MYASYDERTYCMPIMMRGLIVCQYVWELTEKQRCMGGWGAALLVQYLGELFKACFGVFLELISAETTI